MTLAKEQITGLVLAGGRGSRMGGVDKGLQDHLGQPLARHALLRLAPQVGVVVINANRNLPAYEAMGAAVWPDTLPDYPGPLAGFLAGLAHCDTPWMATVPCDSPNFPTDLVARLAHAAAKVDADIAMAATRDADGSLLRQPVFCLLRASLLESLVDFTRSGQRKVGQWTDQHACAIEVFEDAEAFANANTPDELQRLQRSG
jgi:molybdenum cofactor guanylyltransferase